jgi:hypothetical protein
MIAVEFRSMRPGTCGWCRRDKDEVYDVAFSDKSFVGQMCRGDLLRAIGMKLGGDGRAASPSQPVIPASAASAK